MPLYVIRKLSFAYNDFQYEVNGISDDTLLTFKDKMEATRAYVVLERLGYKQGDGSIGYEDMGRATEGEHPYQKLNYFLQQHFPLSGGLQEDWTYRIGKIIPEEATDEQVLEILRLGGLRFYELLEVEDDTHFFKIQVDESEFETGVSLYFSIACNRFYNSYTEALEVALDHLLNKVFEYEYTILEYNAELKSIFEACLRNLNHISYEWVGNNKVFMQINQELSYWERNSPDRQAVIADFRLLFPFLEHQYFEIIKIKLNL